MLSPARSLLFLLALTFGFPTFADPTCEAGPEARIPFQFGASEAVFIGRVLGIEHPERFGEEDERLATVLVDKGFKGANAKQELLVLLPLHALAPDESMLIFARQPDRPVATHRRPLRAEFSELEALRRMVQDSTGDAAWRRIEWNRSIELRLQRLTWFLEQRKLSATDRCWPWAVELKPASDLLRKVEALAAGPSGSTLLLQMEATVFRGVWQAARLSPAGQDGHFKVQGPGTAIVRQDSLTPPASRWPWERGPQYAWPAAPLDASLKVASWGFDAPQPVEFPTKLIAGHYLLKPPRLPGFALNCSSGLEPVPCEHLVAPERGVITRRLRYEPAGVLRVLLFDDQGRQSEAPHLFRFRRLEPLPDGLPFELPVQALFVPQAYRRTALDDHPAMRPRVVAVNSVPADLRGPPLIDVQMQQGDIRLLPGRYALDWWQVSKNTSPPDRRPLTQAPVPLLDGGQPLEVVVRPGLNLVNVRQPNWLKPAELRVHVPDCRRGEVRAALVGDEPLKAFKVPREFDFKFILTSPSCQVSVPGFSGQAFAVTYVEDETAAQASTRVYLEPGLNRVALPLPK